tara:strand:+ start:5962 stop:10374 length:4413 start_codon:yes stop_codon:yes gene_type:complete
MADFRLGRLKFKWRGSWVASTAYVIDDIVKYGGNTYVCTTNHTSSTETSFYSSDLSNWDLHVEGVDNLGNWTGSYWYKVNDIVKYGNTQYLCTVGHTSSSTFDSTKFTVYLEGLNFEDTWTSGTEYQKGDIVTYRGYSYVAKGTHTNTTTPNEDTTNWEVLTTGFSAQGAYDPNTAYSLGDVVRYGGNSYVNKLSSQGVVPTATANWTLITEGLNWTGAWNSATVYQLGDVVNRNSNSYVCITSDTTGAANAPELDPNGNYWNFLAQGGSGAQVLQETGDLLYQAASGVNRIALPSGSTGTAAEQAAASGQILTVGGSPLLPRWEKNNTTASVFYVTKEGADTNNGLSISRGFASLRYACDYISALTGASAPSATNPISIFVKAGEYDEVLPIVLPEFVSIIGDNLRTSIIKPAAGDSNMQALGLTTNLSSIRFGETISNAAGTKTAMVLDSDYNANVHLLNLTGGEWTTSDKYLNIVDNKHADARNLLNSNRMFIAWEAYHRHVANDGAVSGTEATVKSRLAELVDAIAFNVKHGGNNKVYDYGTALVGGTAISGTNATDIKMLEYVESVSIEVMRNILVGTSTGNTQTQVRDLTITTDTNNPTCPTVASAITTLRGIITSAINTGSMAATVNNDASISISSVGTRINAESTMLLLGSGTTVKDLVCDGMSGFVPSGSDDKDMDTATIKGVFFRLNPNSAITKSPYIQNCTIFSGAAVGILLDGGVHSHYDNSSTPSNKSMVFDSFTQVIDGGVGFYVTNGAATEIVSSFTYYAHISYTATRGGRIRAVTGNSSYGKYGAISRGFDSSETTVDGSVKGKRLTIDIANNPIVGSFQIGERLTGGTSGAVGELVNDQNASGFLYYFAVKGTFSQGEVITGATSGVTATLVNNTDAVQGQKGFIITTNNLSQAPAAGGSVELVDNGVNDDSGSYVISNSSYTAPDGRGSLTVERGKLATTAAAHDGTSAVALFAKGGPDATLAANVAAGASSPVTMQVSTVSGMTINGFIAINNELFKVNSFPSATSVEATRAQEGTTSGAHSNNDPVLIFNAKIATQDELIEDATDVATSIRVKQANVGLDADDFVLIGTEFLKITAVVPDTKGITTLQFADEKTIEAGDGQQFKIRYQYSQVRLTAHDFLDIGTGSKANTNWPGLPLSENVPSYETSESRPGRVYYVSTDQDGNFSVGKYFKVEQSTGKATLDASAFDLSGLSSLRLGSIGAQLGAAINEFSTDGTLSQNSDAKVATQKAVKTYIDQLSAVGGDLSVGGNLTVKGTTTSINSVTLTSKDRNIELGKVAVGNFTGDIAQGANTITNVSDTDNIAPGVQITLDSGGGTVTLGTPGIVTAVSGTTVTIDQTFGGSGSATGAAFSTGGATDVTADGGGISLLGTTNKTFNWSNSSSCWILSENMDLASGKAYHINNTSVLSATTVLGKTIVTTVGTDDTSIPTSGAVSKSVNNVSATAYFLSAV